MHIFLDYDNGLSHVDSSILCSTYTYEIPTHSSRNLNNVLFLKYLLSYLYNIYFLIHIVIIGIVFLNYIMYILHNKDVFVSLTGIQFD